MELFEISSGVKKYTEEFEEAKVALITEQLSQSLNATKGILNIDSTILDTVNEIVEKSSMFILTAHDRLNKCCPFNHPADITPVRKDVEKLWENIKSVGLVVQKQPQPNMTFDVSITQKPEVTLILGVESVASMRNKPFVTCKLLLQSDIEGNFSASSSCSNALILKPANCKAVLKPVENSKRWTASFGTMKVEKVKQDEDMEVDVSEDDKKQQPIGTKRKKLNRKNKDSPELAATKKYVFMFNLTLSIGNEIVELTTTTNPFTIATHPSDLFKSSAATVWENAIGNLNETTWSRISSYLSDLFFSLTTKNLEARALMNLKKLYLKDDTLSDETKITREIFVNKDMPRDLVISTASGKKEKCPIFRWFFENAKLVGTKGPLHDYWKEREIIHGFISREEAELILDNEVEGTFIIRFSESRLKSVTIGTLLGKKCQWIGPWSSQELKAQSLANRIRNIENLKFLYGGRSKDDEFGKFYGPQIFTGYSTLVNLPQKGTDEEALTSIMSNLWENAFGSSPEITWGQLATELSELFLSLTTRRLDERDIFYLTQLFLEDINFSTETIVPRKIFVTKTMPRELVFSNTSIKKEKCTIFRWFYENAQLVGMKGPLHNYWKDKRLIRGFITRADAENYLKDQEKGTFIIRFSESKLNSVTIGTFLGNEIHWSEPWNSKDLFENTLANRIRNIEKLKFLFENNSKDDDFGQFYGPQLILGYSGLDKLAAKESVDGSSTLMASNSIYSENSTKYCQNPNDVETPRNSQLEESFDINLPNLNLYDMLDDMLDDIVKNQ